MKLELTELKKRLQVRMVLAVSIESGRLAVDLLRRDESGSQVVKSCVLGQGSDAVLAEPERVGQELAAQLAGAEIKEKRAVVCVPASWAMTAASDMPPVGSEDLRGYLELRAEREFPVATSELKLSHCAFTLPDGQPRATLAAVPAKRIEAIERMLAAAGLRAVSLSLGLESCVPRNGTAAAMHFVANGTHIDLVVAAGGGIASVRSLPKEIDAVSYSREVRITLGRLPEAMRQQVREARFGGTPVTAAELCHELRQPLQRLGIESRLTETEGEHPPGAAREAARRHLRGEPVAFEFLPPQVNRWESLLQRYDSKRHRWVALVLAGVLVLPVLSYFIRSRIESSLATEWNGMKRNVAELESLQQRIREFRPWFEPAPQALAVLESIAGAFPEQGDVWAKSITIADSGKVACSGFARSQSALNALLDQLRARKDVSGVQVQQVRGDNPVQFTLTFKTEVHDAR
jgi:Tfp pilus assembly protein PilN